MGRQIQRRIPRKRIFIGCEGLAEFNYCAFLAAQLEALREDRYLDYVNLRGGDPLAVVENAVVAVRRRENMRGKYIGRFVLLDRDRFGLDPDRDARLLRLSASRGMFLVWQEPCFEAMLLRHLGRHIGERPQTTQIAKQLIRARWPNYEQHLSARQIGAVLKLDDLQRVRGVEPALSAFLGMIGFPDPT
jgi:hypothetical protein